MLKSTLLACAAVAVLALATTVPARATLILEHGLVGGSGGLDNVIFNACGLGGGTGTTVQGCLNSNHATLVDFTGHETLQITGGGQAVINAQDGAMDYFKIKLDNPALGFSELQFNVDGINDGLGHFIATDQFGATFDFGFLTINGHGQNFFTLHSLDNEVAVSLEMLSTVAVQDVSQLQQVRIGPADIGPPPPPPPPGVPEPGTLGLIGLGLAALGWLRHRRSA